MRHNFKFVPHLFIDAEPPADGNGEGGVPTPSPTIDPSQFQELQDKVKAYEGIIEKLRPVERNYKKLEAILGDTNPERLQELREAEQRYQQSQKDQEQVLLQTRNEVAQEYEPRIKDLNDQLSDRDKRMKEIDREYQLYQEFNRNEGIGKKFKTFIRLASDYVVEKQDGTFQVVDESGKQVIYKDKESGDRVATPGDFMKMLASGIPMDAYKFTDLDSLRRTFEPYNKAMGAGLPTANGLPSGKPLHEMSQAELAKYAFKS
jgi:hypothetical protein